MKTTTPAPSCDVCGERATHKRVHGKGLLDLCLAHDMLFVTRRLGINPTEPVVVEDWGDEYDPSEDIDDAVSRSVKNDALHRATKGLAKAASIVDPVLKRWLAGESPKVLAAELGLKPGKFRRLCRKATTERPPRTSPTPPSRRRSPGGAGTASSGGGNGLGPDDGDVPIMTQAGARAWMFQRTWDAPIFVDPEGGQWVKALDSQKAELIYAHDCLGLPWIRLRRHAGSHIAKRDRRAEALVERGEAALEATKETKQQLKKPLGKKRLARHQRRLARGGK